MRFEMTDFFCCLGVHSWNQRTPELFLKQPTLCVDGMRLHILWDTHEFNSHSPFRGRTCNVSYDGFA